MGRSDHHPGRFAGYVTTFGIVAAVAALAICGLLVANRMWPTPFSPAEVDVLRSLSLSAAPLPPRPDPSNRYADDPRAAALGAQLFRDARLSASGRISCATCHVPAYAFSDGRTVARGAAVGRRNTPSVVGGAHAAWLFWDGRRDSLWAQALVPLEGAAEHDTTRSDVAKVVLSHYRAPFEAVFGPIARSAALLAVPGPASPVGSAAAQSAWAALPEPDRLVIDRTFANVGKALAAYQRRLAFTPARFDRYVEQLARGNRLLATLILTDDEQRGLRLFIGKGQCVLCHSGPLLTNHDFFALGLPHAPADDDGGRGDAFESVRGDVFNCLGPHSDAAPADCRELSFMSGDRLAFWRSYKTPSLRNVALTAPYMHGGQFRTLDEVVQHYSVAPRPRFPEHSDVPPRAFTPDERKAVVAFLGTLTAPIDDPVRPPSQR